MPDFKMRFEWMQNRKMLTNDEFLREIASEKSEYKLVKARDYKHKTSFSVYNIPAAFDIETSSFYCGAQKVGLMYIWQFGLNGLVTSGRTWEDFESLIARLIDVLGLSESRRLYIYVHNLAFEFSFIRSHFDWDFVFSIETRRPIYARAGGLDFRCSYLLSGYSLDFIAGHLARYHVDKLVGDLDYSLIRSPSTPMSDRELDYCRNDILVLLAYIQEKIEDEGKITAIPLTKTGYVRRYVRNKCFGEGDRRQRARYSAMIKTLSIERDEYDLLHDAFQGGFTHANPFNVAREMHDVTSFDFASAYPAVMIAERFPMTKGEKITIRNRAQFEKNLKYYACVFRVDFIKLRAKFYADNYISSYHCFRLVDPVVQNGRVVSAEALATTVTEIDFEIITATYEWDDIRIGTFYRYRRDYLPRPFCEAILKLYEDKTTLKNVEGREIEYQQSKEMLNSTYGMTVTNIVREEIEYSNLYGWDIPEEEKKKLDIAQALEEYNTGSRFLFYAWGIYVTAFCRRNLWSAILHCHRDYIYSDTDSVKLTHAERYQDYIDNYNEQITAKINRALEYYHFDVERGAPLTIKGVKKPLGVWEREETFETFKTLGAKRYMVRHADGSVNITVSGLNKKKTVPYLINTYGNNIFNAFDDNMYISPEHTGKNTHTYIDDERAGKAVDYLGQEFYFQEKTGCHIEPAEYSLGMAADFIDYIEMIQTQEEIV